MLHHQSSYDHKGRNTGLALVFDTSVRTVTILASKDPRAVEEETPIFLESFTQTTDQTSWSCPNIEMNHIVLL